MNRITTKKTKKPPTDQQIIEQLADLNYKFEFIVQQFQILNQTVQNESQKNEEFHNKQEKWNKNQEQKIGDLKNEIKKDDQKVDNGSAQVNQCLDKIENCPTIKKELAEQVKKTENENSDSKNEKNKTFNDEEEK